MIQYAPFRAVALLWLLVSVAGCGGSRDVPVVPSTPANPVWDRGATQQTVRSLRSAVSVLDRSGAGEQAEARAARVADYLAQQMRRYGVQPGVERYRLHYLQPAGEAGVRSLPLMLGLVAGRDPLDTGAVLVYAPLDAERAAAGAPVRAAAWLELARVYTSLGRYYRFPVRTLVFAMPVIPAGEGHAAALRTLVRQSVWPLDHLRAVVVLGVPEANAEAWQAAGLPTGIPVEVLEGGAVTEGAPSAEEQAIALARRAYTWLLPEVGADGGPTE